MRNSMHGKAAAGVAPAATVDFGRRQFLARAGAGALWVPLARLLPASLVGCAPSALPPPELPAPIPLYKQAWQNWSKEIVIDALWTCAPRSAADVVDLANWARAEGWQLRARGRGHGWSPLTVTPDSDTDSRILLVDTTQAFNAMQIVAAAPGVDAVQCGAGAILEDLLAYLEQQGHGFATHPATGDITIGGMLAINGHGASLPAAGETRTAGHHYGSLSHLILALTAVVWDEGQQRYHARSFARTEAGIAPLLVHLGRAFLIDVTLQVGPLQNLRCQSFTDVGIDELFAPAGSPGRTFASYVEQTGRAEAIWFPYTQRPWMKVWSLAPDKPPLSRTVAQPYNYLFSDNLPEPVTDLVDALLAGHAEVAPLFGNAMLTLATTGLAATLSNDLWGASKNTQLYIKATTIRARETGYPILTRRSDLQRVLNEFKDFFVARVEAYRERGLYPMNMPVEIRCTGLDHADAVLLRGAQPPLLSGLLPRADHPEWDIAIWINLLCLVGTPGSDEFYTEVQEWFISHFSGAYAAVRPEWSKGWAHTAAGSYTNEAMLRQTIPGWFRAGRPAGQRWDDAIAGLDALDPYRIFSNPFLDRFMA